MHHLSKMLWKRKVFERSAQIFNLSSALYPATQSLFFSKNSKLQGNDLIANFHHRSNNHMYNDQLHLSETTGQNETDVNSK